MKIDILLKRIDALHTQLEKQCEPQEVTFITYWGNEEIEDDGTPIFRTEWGGGPLDEAKAKARSGTRTDLTCVKIFTQVESGRVEDESE